MFSDAALRVLHDEEEVSINPSNLTLERLTGKSAANVTFYNPGDIGARIASGSMPGFYHKPKSVDDMVDQFVMKVLDSMGVPNSLGSRWKEPTEIE